MTKAFTGKTRSLDTLDPLPPSLLDAIPTLNATQFKALPEKERLKIHDDLLEVLLYSHAKDMATDKVFLRKKLDRNDVVSYGILRDKRLQQAQTSGIGLKAPQFFINSLQIAILQQTTTPISSNPNLSSVVEIMETVVKDNKDNDLNNPGRITTETSTLSKNPTNRVGDDLKAGGG